MNIGDALRLSGCHIETIRYYERGGASLCLSLIYE